MKKYCEEYVVQCNINPETHTEEYWWLDYHTYTTLEAATEDFWEVVQDDDPDIGHRIVHRIVETVEEIVEPAWVEEIEG